MDILLIHEAYRDIAFNNYEHVAINKILVKLAYSLISSIIITGLVHGRHHHEYATAQSFAVVQMSHVILGRLHLDQSMVNYFSFLHRKLTITSMRNNLAYSQHNVMFICSSAPNFALGKKFAMILYIVTFCFPAIISKI